MYKKIRKNLLAMDNKTTINILITKNTENRMNLNNFLSTVI